MRQRALIHIGGQLGAGKTTLAEAAIAHADQDVLIAARCLRDDSLTEPRGFPRSSNNSGSRRSQILNGCATPRCRRRGCAGRSRRSTTVSNARNSS